MDARGRSRLGAQGQSTEWGVLTGLTTIGRVSLRLSTLQEISAHSAQVAELSLGSETPTPSLNKGPSL